ncbi:TetR/AcrR family transcriptional regulator [Streptomyces phaeochromogenes]|uniref:TetR/AcrR family transcriptional regulator n=1 Tax=Streptomyces phaeochromogenes TaxID=1923 RepID=A0ABZ1H756_STRPH|nr:TetR/AcrR family transcriptional regulator C-terminal domain-containing protein [Streptomyces phaeochromogenes]WSD14383.1 TetR/AcrR family transcriptional regulator [Streptomyces phaeochromogenes]
MTTTGQNPLAGDRRVRRTHAALQGALIKLVEEAELGQISVADVAEQAGVNRTTFYDHYRDVHELAEAACTSTIDTLIESLPVLDPAPADPDADPARSLVAFFENLAEHAGLYRSLLGPQGSARVIDHIRSRISTAVHVAVRLNAGAPPENVAPTDIPHDVPAAFTAGALLGVATDWLQRDSPRTPTEMAELTWPLLVSHHLADAQHAKSFHALAPDGA